MRKKRGNDGSLAGWAAPGAETSGWDNEGQYVLSASLPALPFGYQAQPVLAFSDPTGNVSYELHRVYRQERALTLGGSIVAHRLDEDLSYWVVTWPVSRGTADERPVSRWLSYRQARKALNGRLAFRRFASLGYGRDEVQALDVRTGHRPAPARPGRSETPQSEIVTSRLSPQRS